MNLTIRPACGLPGDYSFSTDTASLFHMLKRQTDLPATVLDQFRRNLATSPSARLLGVELNDQTLEEIGYFID